MLRYLIRRRGAAFSGRHYCGETADEAAAFWWERLPPCERQSGTFQLEMRLEPEEGPPGPWVPVNLLVEIEPVSRLVKVSK